jgi:hypothetical protein
MTSAILRDLLQALSTAFRTRDLEGVLHLLSTTATVTYAGSEHGEKATGRRQLRALLSDLLGRPEAYSFDLPDITFGEHSGLVWMLADGEATQSADDGSVQTFAYRLTGVLADEKGHWRWLMLAGSEPTPG